MRVAIVRKNEYLEKTTMKRYFLLEFLIIFISVMLAFLTEDWRENRQDRKEYEAVLKEIESNIRRDSVEISNDCNYLENQLDEIISLIDSAQYFSAGRLHKLVFEVGRIRWPDFEFTGFEQLKNHVSYPEDADLIRQINGHYSWLYFLIERHEFMDIRPAVHISDYLTKKEIAPPYFQMSEEDSSHLRELFSEGEFLILLKNLVASKSEQLGYYRTGQQSGVALLRRFRNVEGEDLQITAISLIGTGLGTSWNSEMYLERVDDKQWEIRTHLNTGFVKFRSNSTWVINWGSTEFPTGKGTQDGPDIPVVDGEYLIKFNQESGEYSFELIAP